MHHHSLPSQFACSLKTCISILHSLRYITISLGAIPSYFQWLLFIVPTAQEKWQEPANSIRHPRVSLGSRKVLQAIYKNIYEVQILPVKGATTSWFTIYSLTYFHSILLEIGIIPASTNGKTERHKMTTKDWKTPPASRSAASHDYVPVREPRT